MVEIRFAKKAARPCVFHADRAWKLDCGIDRKRIHHGCAQRLAVMGGKEVFSLDAHGVGQMDGSSHGRVRPPGKRLTFYRRYEE